MASGISTDVTDAAGNHILRPRHSFRTSSKPSFLSLTLPYSILSKEYPQQASILTGMHKDWKSLQMWMFIKTGSGSVDRSKASLNLAFEGLVMQNDMNLDSYTPYASISTSMLLTATLSISQSPWLSSISAHPPVNGMTYSASGISRRSIKMPGLHEDNPSIIKIKYVRCLLIDLSPYITLYMRTPLRLASGLQGPGTQSRGDSCLR